jgi:putative flippase GtrA
VSVRLPLAQLFRFSLSGAVVTLTNYVLMFLFLRGLELPAQLSLALSYGAGLCVHFTLNRQLVFTHEAGYRHRLSGQGARYLAVAATSYALLALAIGTLPDVLDVPVLAVYLPATILLAVTTFVLLRSWIFRPVAR